MRENNEGQELMNKDEWLEEQFEANRTHLQAVAYRVLGSLSEADDAVQESWLRLSRSDTSGIENPGGWLTTVVARICLDMLRARNARREESLEAAVPESIESREEGSDPEQEALLADSVGLALLVVLDTLPPAERLSFVLHDIFAVPFDEIAPIVERSEEAARQLASRARRRVRGAETTKPADLERQRAVVDAFLAATRSGNFEALLAVLDPDVVVRHDLTGMEIRGAQTAARRFSRGAQAAALRPSARTQGAQAALVNGSVGIVVARRGRLLFVFNFTIRDDKIVEIEAVADPARLRQLHIAVLDE